MSSTRSSTKRKAKNLEENKSKKDSSPGPSKAKKSDEKIVVKEAKKRKTAAKPLRLWIWNVNGLRACVKKGGHEQIADSDADIVILQETKCSEFPPEIEALDGYPFKKLCVSTQSAGGYAGVAMLCREKPLKVELGTGDKDFDHQARFIQAEFPNYFVIGVYMMNSGRKLENLARRQQLENLMLEKLRTLDGKKPVIYCGDLNVAHEEIDLRNPEMNRNKTAGFTDQERADFTRLLNNGFVDVWRRRNPEIQAYTYWSYLGNRRANNVGWRLDYFVVSERIFENVVACEIHSNVTGSDHCPLSMDINI